MAVMPWALVVHLIYTPSGKPTRAYGITINMLLYLYPNGYSIVLIVGLVLVILFVTYT